MGVLSGVASVTAGTTRKSLGGTSGLVESGLAGAFELRLKRRSAPSWCIAPA